MTFHMTHIQSEICDFPGLETEMTKYCTKEDFPGFPLPLQTLWPLQSLSF